MAPSHPCLQLPRFASFLLRSLCFFLSSPECFHKLRLYNSTCRAPPHLLHAKLRLPTCILSSSLSICPLLESITQNSSLRIHHLVSMAWTCTSPVMFASSLSPRPPTRCSSVSSSPTATPADSLVRLGNSPLHVSPLGIGAWSWGDRFLWNASWDDRNIKDSRDAFNVAMDNGISFFDTAEVYGSPQWAGGDDSESLLGRAIKDRERKGGSERAIVATKFAAYPWRFSRSSVVVAIRQSLARLGLSSLDLYQLHWPGLWGNEGYIDGLGDAVEQGLVKAVGVSNYNEKRLRAAHEQLAKRGIPLASNQVHYSLIYRLPEENNVKKTCDELGVTLIAYSPLAQGVLSGKYTASNPPPGGRGRTYNADFLTQAAPLLSKMREVGNKYGKSNTQVALNWLLRQGNVVPIPGAKSAAQAEEFAGALGWSLSEDDERELHYLARKVKPVTGFPAESF